MKKFLLLALLAVLALSLVACSSIGNVEQTIEGQDYVGVDMSGDTEQTPQQDAIANAARGNYTRIRSIPVTDKNAKLYVWGIEPQTFMEMTNPNYAIVVEFSSRDALLRELNDNADFRAIAEEVVGDGDVKTLVYEKGAAVDNCFIYAKGAKAKDLYQLLAAK